MKKILFLGDYRYGYFQGGNFHFARQFALHGFRVAFVSYFISPLHFLWTEDKVELKKRIHIWRNGGSWEENKVWNYVPFTLLPISNKPILNSRWIIENSYRFTIPSLKRILKKNDFETVDILWLNSTLYGFGLDIVGSKYSILRIADEFSHLDIPKSFITKSEEVYARVNKIIIPSRVMYQKHKNIPRDKIIYLPNAVDFDNYVYPSEDQPEEYRRIPTPRVLCLGGINNSEDFDINLIRYIAKKLPDVSFIFIGRPFIDVSKIEILPNVFILGFREYHKIHTYIQHADIGIVPYKLSQKTDSYGGGLLKIYEYMACGLPVVSLKFKEFENIYTLVHLAKDYDEFVFKIKQALKEKDDEKEKYIEFAKKNTWKIRFKELMKAICPS